MAKANKNVKMWT